MGLITTVPGIALSLHPRLISAVPPARVLQIHRIQFQQRVQQHIRAVRDVGGRGKFARAMAAAVAAGHKNHADGTALRDLLSVVACAARHQLRRETQLLRHVVNHTTKAGISGRGLRCGDLFELELCAGRRFDLTDFGLNLFVEHLHFRRIQSAQAKTRHDLARHDVLCARERLKLANGSDLPTGD